MTISKISQEIDEWSLEKDLVSIFERCQNIWMDLKDANIFITGGTGFIGCWILESLIYATRRLNLNIKATVLTRSIDAFVAKAPHLATSPFVVLLEGDVSNFSFPIGNFSYVIHAATEASAELNENYPLQMFKTVIDGTERVLDFAVHKKVLKMLFLSSGAVYGQQPWEMLNVPESYIGGPSCTDPRATYAEAKRSAEMLCAIYQKQYGLQTSIARIFALLGPYLSLDIHFAAGNFIRDAIHGRQIVIKGNGRPCRSYLYTSDLVVYLWHILVRGMSCKPYNVGSEVGISIRDLAERVSELLGGVAPLILNSEDAGWNQGRYVPSVELISSQLGLSQTVTLDQAILRTAMWNGWGNKK